MAVAGDRLETYAQMQDDDGDPLTGLTITFLDSRDPNGDELDADALTWDEIEPGNYAVYFQSSVTDPVGQYYVSFQFDDPYEEIWTENNWQITDSALVLYPATAPPAQTGTPQNVAPHRRDADDTHDSQYYKRGEEAIPAAHIHLTGGTLAAFGESDSIQLTQIGNTLYAVAKFGTTPASIAEGDKLAAKLSPADVSPVALSGSYGHLINVPTTFTPAPHSHDASAINAGTIDISRLPVGTGASQVASGAHTHTLPDGFNIPIGYVGGGAIATGTYVDFIIPRDFIPDDWMLVVMGPSGLIQLDCWLKEYDTFPPLVANSVCGSNKPRITVTGNKARSSGTFGWSAGFAKGRVLRVNVDSCTTIEQVTLFIGGTALVP